MARAPVGAGPDARRLWLIRPGWYPSRCAIQFSDYWLVPRPLHCHASCTELGMCAEVAIIRASKQPDSRRLYALDAGVSDTLGLGKQHLVGSIVNIVNHLHWHLACAYAAHAIARILAPGDRALKHGA